jgi:hypothetical protein
MLSTPNPLLTTSGMRIVRTECRGEVAGARELFGGERVDKEFADGAQVRDGGCPKRRGATAGEDDLGTSAVGGALFPADEVTAFHPAYVVGQTAALPANVRGEFR